MHVNAGSKSNVFVRTHASAHHSPLGSEVPPSEEAVTTVWAVHF